MSNETFYIGQGDRVPSISRTLKIGNPETAIDLTAAASVTFQLADKEGVIVASGACTVTNAAGGVVQYDWAVGDTDAAGQFKGRFVVEWPGSKQQTVPNNGDVAVLVSEAFTSP